jgi:hypothetical protein
MRVTELATLTTELRAIDQSLADYYATERALKTALKQTHDTVIREGRFGNEVYVVRWRRDGISQRAGLFPRLDALNTRFAEIKIRRREVKATIENIKRNRP